MRTSAALLVGVVLLAGLAMAGAATATQADGTYHSLNESSNQTDDGNGTGVGVCVIGVDSPCNGAKWDGDDDIGDEQNTSERIEPVEGNGDSGEVGICVTGVDSPCNGEENDGDDAGGELTPVEDNETREGSEPIKNETDGEDATVGVCVIGVDSPCNGEEHDSDSDIGGEEIEPIEGDEGGEAGICLVGADSACNGAAEADVTVEPATAPSQSILERLFGPVWTLFWG